MTNYNDGKWHGWNGGDCPVHPNTTVEFVTDEGRYGETRAGARFWTETLSDDAIRAFRVVKEHREPREFWINEYPGVVGSQAHDSKETADAVAGESRIRCIHVREVLE